MHVDRQHTWAASVATTNHRYRFTLLVCRKGAVADLDCHRTQPTTRRSCSASPPARERNAEKGRRPAWPPACAVRRQRTHRTNGAWDLTTNTGFVSPISRNVDKLGEDGWLSLGVRPLPPVCSPSSLRPQSGPRCPSVMNHRTSQRPMSSGGGVSRPVHIVGLEPKGHDRPCRKGRLEMADGRHLGRSRRRRFALTACN
jgi:hypothetical protein